MLYGDAEYGSVEYGGLHVVVSAPAVSGRGEILSFESTICREMEFESLLCRDMEFESYMNTEDF